MPYTTQNPRIEFEQPAREAPPPAERRGCLFALSQPPLMLFLAVIGALLAITGAHDLFLL